MNLPVSKFDVGICEERVSIFCNDMLATIFFKIMLMYAFHHTGNTQSYERAKGKTLLNICQNLMNFGKME